MAAKAAALVLSLAAFCPSAVANVPAPASRRITYSYNALGQVTDVADGSGRVYATGVEYEPDGGMSRLAFGNGLVERTSYNSRLQVSQIRLGDTLPDSAGSFVYSYTGATCDGQTWAANSGNVVGQTIKAGSVTYSQSYGYDTFNRLKCAKEGTTWEQIYGYDRFGNRWVSTSTIPLQAITATQQSDFNAKNQLITAPTGMRSNGAPGNYDGAGNLLNIAAGSAPHTLTYDAENRIVASANNGIPTQNVYDGFGRRVKAGGRIFAYAPNGDLALELTPANSETSTRYLTSDHLGSTRIITKEDKSVEQRFDYLPFGEEIPSGVGTRAAAIGYLGMNGLMTAASGPRHRFTGKERDAETGLDYFGARYLSAAQGRFTSPDPKILSWQRVVDPQQWNLYAYTRNNPLIYIDPDGRELRMAIYTGKLPGNVATATANLMVRKLATAGVKNITYELKPGSPNGFQTFAAQILPSPHSVLVELRPSKAGDPTLKTNEAGHNYGGQAVFDTSAVTSKTNDPTEQAIGIANAAVHEVAHEVNAIHEKGDPIMDRDATDENMVNPNLNFGPSMSKKLRNRYNRSGEEEQAPPPPPPPPPPSCSIPGTNGACRN